jgi:hypothetical protein
MAPQAEAEVSSTTETLRFIKRSDAEFSIRKQYTKASLEQEKLT